MILNLEKQGIDIVSYGVTKNKELQLFKWLAEQVEESAISNHYC